MLLMIDNYDSFTYNIVQYLAELGQEVVVKCNDAIDIADINDLTPNYIVIGPGPCSPKEAGISVDVIRHFAGKIPILGVCLGHQALGFAYGGTITRARSLMHGKTSLVHHTNKGVFSDLPNPVTCTRYHSLVVSRDHLPDCLEITAWTDDQEIMGLRHKTLPLEGIQFHPEGLLTEHGHDMLSNFLHQHQTKIM